MAVYGMYNFSRDPDVNKQECIKFFSAILGRTLGSIEEIEAALSDIYINGRSLAGTKAEEAANALRESLDVESLNVAMVKTNGVFEPIKDNNYVKLRDILDNDPPEQEAKDAKTNRDSGFIEYMNNIDRVNLSEQKNVIIAGDSENAIEYLKNVTGMENIDESNIKTALESIYIDGRNLSDSLGEAAQPEDYANAVRNALDLKNDSVVSVMKKNSVLSEPKVVLPVYEDAAVPEAREKTAAALAYAKSYRDTMCNEARLVSADQENREERDRRIFFQSLFTTPNPYAMAGVNLKETTAKLNGVSNEVLASINPARLSSENYENFVARLIDDPLEKFIFDREPQNECYAYMLTKINPKTNDYFTMDEILFDDSDEMLEQKKLAGEEVCNIFKAIRLERNGNEPLTPQQQSLEVQLNAEHYNKEIYPLLCKMTERLVQVKAELGDVCNKDGIIKERRANSIYHIVQDMVQQFEKNSNLAEFINSTNAVTYVGNPITENRSDFLCSESFRTGDLSIRNAQNTVLRGVVAQAAMDEIGAENLSNVPMGAVDGVLNQNYNRLGEAYFNKITRVEVNDIEKYIAGEPNPISDKLNSEEAKSAISDFRESYKKAKEVGSDDALNNIIDTYLPFTVNPVKEGNPAVSLDKVQRAFFGTPDFGLRKILKSGEGAKECEGMNKSFFMTLTSCPLTPDTDKALIWRGLEKIYINSKPATVYFNLDEVPDFDRLKEIEKTIAQKLIQGIENNGPEFVSLKCGPNNFKPVQIKPQESALEMPNRAYFNNEAAYKTAMDKYQLYENKVNALKAGNETADTYAKLMSGTAAYNELKNCSERLSESGIKVPAEYINFKEVRKYAESDDYAKLICAFTGTDSPREALAKSDRYLINKKPLEYAYSPYMNDEIVNMMITSMGKEIKKAFDKSAKVDDSWIRVPFMIKNERGEAEPVKYFIEAAEEPKKVERLSGFSRLIASSEEKADADKKYKAYEEEMKKYKAEKAENDKIGEWIKKYNTEADLMRVEMLREKSGAAPAVRTTDLNTLSSRSSASNNPPRLTRPENSNQRTMDQPTMNTPTS